MMKKHREVIRGAYLGDILAQPDALAATVNGLFLSHALREVAAREYRRIVLTGMGASLHALHPLHVRLVARGFTSVMVETSELVHAMPALAGEGTLIVAVSQSGRSAETVRLLDLPQRGTIVGVTNTPESPLAQHADATVMMHAGAEATVSCKTYVATLAALAWLGDVLCDGAAGEGAAALGGAAPAVRGYLDDWDRHVEALAAPLEGVRDLFYAGRGASLAAALTAGLTTKESTRYHAEGMSSAALRHGPIEMMGDSVFALVYAGEGETAALNARLVEDLRGFGARAFLCGPGAELAPLALPEEISPFILPILEILPAQMITIALGAIAGIEAGRFVHATKVTDRE